MPFDTQPTTTCARPCLTPSIDFPSTLGTEVGHISGHRILRLPLLQREKHQRHTGLEASNPSLLPHTRGLPGRASQIKSPAHYDLSDANLPPENGRRLATLLCDELHTPCKKRAARGGSHRSFCAAGRGNFPAYDEPTGEGSPGGPSKRARARLVPGMAELFHRPRQLMFPFCSCTATRQITPPARRTNVRPLLPVSSALRAATKTTSSLHG
jgi:hypothetical protein